ncbi:MAG: isoleucine--tRNA ligase [Bacteroidaceae bacterium]|nr:isoleucine--tRNA ligase [Prevotellaceae bacterium]MDY4759195.1 isoleucine--tRNA ligase [Bacteroidaceae bacterium]
MQKKFEEHSDFNLSEINKQVLEEWDKNHAPERSVSEHEGFPHFTFYEGPPSANGHPGIHHVLARTIKDTICRYKTMKGFYVPRKAGWDTHGLPVELGVEKEMGITKDDIGKTVSIEEYNAHCRSNVMKFTAEWENLSRLMGYWVDMKRPYITYENYYIESVWWLLHNLYSQGLIYKGYTIQPYSPAAGTGLSSHELNMPGCYRDVKDTTVTAMFRMTSPQGAFKTDWGETYFMAWTTTPWTLPSNTALCVGPKIDYVLVNTFNPYTAQPISVVMAEARIASYFNPAGAEAAMENYEKGGKILPYRVVAHFKGTDLEGLKYEQLFAYVNPGEGAFRVILGDYVSTEDGTGIVHIAPTFGADDAFVAKKAGVPALQLIDKNGNKRPMVDLKGRFYKLEDLDEDFKQKHMNVDLYKTYAGRFVKNAYDDKLTDKDETLDISICMELKASGLAFRIEKHVHNYPHCWRTDKPILYYPLDSWFIRSTARKERMFELNKNIKWKPQSTGTGRFGKWLENLNDWNLSRSRFWGTPLPIWRSESGEEICISSIEELYSEIEKSVKAGNMTTNPFKKKGFVPGDYSDENYHKIDLHRPYVDNIILTSPSGKPMKRETDLIDVWFDSGSMPFAQLHYPFENREQIEKNLSYPADFIAEGVDQTRGWFFTLHAISTMIRDSLAFKAVISNGLVLDKNGNKMSKHLGNAIDPFKIIEKYGVDPVRWYMMTNSSPWENLKFDEAGVAETSRTFFGKLHQTYSFFAMYANVDNFNYSETDVPSNERPELDRWILSELNSLVKKVDEAYNDYEPTRAGRYIETFTIDNLSNWFVRLSRKRFWGSSMSQDKLSAYQTLYTCLVTLSKLIAPLSPFYADRLYKSLASVTGKDLCDSVHLSEFPKVNDSVIDKELELRMEMAQKITSMVLSLRKKESIIVRQPLQKITIPASKNSDTRKHIEEVAKLILDEVNVKELEFVEDDNLLKKRVQPNFRILGKKYGKLMKEIAQAVKDMSQEDIRKLESEGVVSFNILDQNVTINLDEVEVVNEDIPGYAVANDGALTVALDLEITENLRIEGQARELVKHIQTFRKESGFEITDRINITIEDSDVAKNIISNFKDYISTQVLAKSFTISPKVENGEKWNIGDTNLTIKIEK